MTIGSAARASSRAAMPMRTSVMISAQATRSLAVILSQPFAVIGSGRPEMGIPISRQQRSRTVSRLMLAGIVCVVLTCAVSQPCVSVVHNRARRNSDAGLAIVAQRPRMKWEHRIAIYICRNCLLRRRLALHQLPVIVEDRFYELVDELVRQILMGDRKVVHSDRMIVAGQRTIGSRRNH